MSLRTLESCREKGAAVRCCRGESVAVGLLGAGAFATSHTCFRR